jgi:hypothetical protein
MTAMLLLVKKKIPGGKGSVKWYVVMQQPVLSLPKFRVKS